MSNSSNTAFVVIGAGYGDEGKGMVTAALVKEHQISKVMRFNGGPQAGHTVQDGDKRHVFSHYNSGLMYGADTYFGDHAICNPIVVEREYNELVKSGIVTTPPRIAYHPNSKFTTIYDMVINNLVEQQRGTKAHGSCGLGINETIRRENAGFRVMVDYSHQAIIEDFENIRANWVERRIEELGITNIPPEMQRILSTPARIHAEQFIEAFNKFRFGEFYNFEFDSDLVMEGAQGLLLDEQFGEFPHVTPSMTGLPQAISNVKNLFDLNGNFFQVQPVYVSRTFLTRHGNGPFVEDNPFVEMTYVDATNVTNQFQGNFKYGVLDIDLLISTIEQDMLRGTAIANLYNLKILRPKLFLTHMDMKTVRVKSSGEIMEIDCSDLIQVIAEHIDIIGYSFGPDVADVMFI